ncbi:putative nucleotidyltransferase substrate binding domain-containing protein [Nocardioides coralli]|uniref:putative nucleotidyltransferase substrate binding domain-containing protein n=1 Tax=Nocardioides coralli TaxID=2872154 RepID=UPI001CA43983|nr:putative nucleotidyltransferase substrate binding domain-containing protein [Nocardioides coralli]QZY28217.1 DUF294 nucleotidyltransferase-like domain-containing protein [Nocardioides coralli]
MALDVELAEIRDFLGSHPPFEALSPDELTAITPRLSIVYRRRGTEVLAAGERVGELLVVRSGAVESRDEDGALLERGGAGTCVGGGALAAEVPQPVGVVAIEDSLLLAMPAAVFHELLAQHPEVSAHFSQRARALAAAVSVQRTHRAEGGGRAVLRTRARDLVTRTPVSVPATATIREAAEVMSRERISSVLVTTDDRLVGILTDRDLRTRVVAAGASPEAPVTSVMTPDPVTGHPDALALEVLLELLRRNIHHLPLVVHGRAVGMITATDLLQLEHANPVHLVGEVAKAADPAAVAEVARRLDELVSSLVRQGTTAHDAGRVVTSVGDAVEQRLLGLAEAELGPPPVPYAWITLGSRARFEQALGPDQDHALVVHDDHRPEHDAWFAALAERVTDGLEQAGYPRCRGEKMATNPSWRLPVTAWREHLLRWMTTPTPQAVMESSVFFDLRHQYGDGSLTAVLRDLQRETAPRSPLFLAHLAAHACTRQPPLGFFRGLVVDRSGEHRDTLDVKRGGLLIVAEIGRLHGLAAGSPATGTLARLEDAAADGRISAPLAADLRDAWEFLAHLRLVHQAERVRAGEPPDNHVPPASLSSFEQRHLKAAFGVIRDAQSAVAQRYPVRTLS